MRHGLGKTHVGVVVGILSFSMDDGSKKQETYKRNKTHQKTKTKTDQK